MRRFLTTLLTILVISSCAFAQELARCKAGTPEQIIRHEGYTVSYNERNLTPNWSGWVLTAERVADKSVSRAAADEQFVPDPSVKGATAWTTDYSRSGYDRGHMAPAADMKFSATAMIESFYLSNICPQNPDLNYYTWCDLEKKCRYWAYNYSPVSIVCGPIYDAQNIERIGKNGVAVPVAFFKVVRRVRKGKPEVMGFMFPNKPITDEFWKHECLVSDIEEITGITFFPSDKDIDKSNTDFDSWRR